MEKLNRLFPKQTANPWTHPVSDVIGLRWLSIIKIKGKQYARPFTIGFKPLTKKEIHKSLKNLNK